MTAGGVGGGDREIRVGVIGIGGLAGNVHLPALAAIRQARLTALCDVRLPQAERAAARFGVPAVYTDYRRLLAEEQLDCVFVLTEPDQLFRIVHDCVAQGLPTFMEKPPGITVFQADTLDRLATATGVPIQVGFNRRFIPVVVECLRILREHTTITHVDGRFFKHGSAAFYDGCASALECDTIHCLDFAAFVAAGRPVRGAMIETQRGEAVANAWQTIVEFDTGVTATVCGNYMTGGRVHQLDLHGPEGSAYINLGFGDSSCSAEIILNEGAESQSIAARGEGKHRRISLDGRSVAGGDQFYEYYGFLAEDRSFIEAVATGTPPACGIADGLATLRLVEFLRNARLDHPAPQGPVC